MHDLYAVFCRILLDQGENFAFARFRNKFEKHHFHVCFCHCGVPENVYHFWGKFSDQTQLALRSKGTIKMSHIFREKEQTSK